MGKYGLSVLQIKFVVAVGAIALYTTPLKAQVVPDDTLGNERSRVRQEQVDGRERDVIDGGARRGTNLFHSFDQFDVEARQRVYFDPAQRVETIFSRITGSDRSEIRGTLGVLGDADLFLINPNGVLIGRDANLDLSGSLTVTSADALHFENRETFSAVEPEAPSPLLTVDPSVSVLNRRGSTDDIVVRSSFTLRSQISGLVVDPDILILSGRDVLRLVRNPKNINFVAFATNDAFGDLQDILDSEQEIAQYNREYLEENPDSFFLPTFDVFRSSFINTDALLATSCIYRTTNDSTFFVTRPDGFPERPGDASIPQYPTGRIRAIPTQFSSSESTFWQAGDPIEEPDGLYQLSSGQIILSQECTLE